MIDIVIIKKNGDPEKKSVKKIDEDNLYKNCGYKTNKDFECIHSYVVGSHEYRVFGKKVGKANYENKYEFPPPIDEVLLFGTVCIIKRNADTQDIEGLSLEEWQKVYEDLFGGFDDVGNSSDDDERSMDSEIYEDEEYTEDGYLKDGFVISDEDNDELEEEEYLDYDDA